MNKVINTINMLKKNKEKVFLYSYGIVKMQIISKFMQKIHFLLIPLKDYNILKEI